MYFGILIALVPLGLGYLIKIKNNCWMSKINLTLSWMIYLILFIMGAELAHLDNLATNLQVILYYAIVLFICTFGGNFVVLMMLDFFSTSKNDNVNQIYTSHFKMILESLRVCIALIVGFICGLLPLFIWQYAENVTQIVLVFLLFLVGIQLRSNNISIKQILLNKVGMTTSILVVMSVLLGGIVASFILNLPVRVGLAMSSGFGWYSLSGILMTEAHGPVIGSATFLNDILRELCAIILIPTLIKRYQLTTLGLCGATSMDFTLPMLQKGGGIAIVPAAIAQGFLLTLIMPIIITLFNYGGF
ncbi:lysine exporter LysO family protein [Gilliamella sp. ESL0250]|uniref:lysine exporter LysO family protein n=1 Tax=Gilliamella sp. ESL0250 TaxID=2705036 RepID=UPI001580465D|nr:lysine exporter LysO family protein [Gilliamella sp. ESL0250]NUF49747.1 lysine exporter LysO family protein [Gilliamella sp. ESL0250]